MAVKLTERTSSWRDKIRVDLAKELTQLRHKNNSQMQAALKDEQVQQRFMIDPAGVFDQLEIPISSALRRELKGASGMEQLSVPRYLRLPVNQVVTPEVTIRINDEPATTPQPTGVSTRDFWNPFINFFKQTGQQTHGYPVVYEITKSCVKDLVAQWFDKGPLHDLLESLVEKIPDPLVKALSQVTQLAQKSFDLKFDIGMPAGMTTQLQDIVTTTLHIPAEPPASSGEIAVSAVLSLSASLVVDHSDYYKEQFYLDLANHLAFAEAKITVANLPIVGTKVFDLSSEFTMLLKTVKLGQDSDAGKIPVFFDVPIDRSGSNTALPTELDIRIIDDPSSADCDAIALLMSFAEMGPGNRDAFTQSFIQSGSGLVVDFNWLRSKMLPKLQTALGLPTPIDPTTGFWIGQSPIPGQDGTFLTMLAIGVLNGSRDITVLAGVRKNGDCYTATGSMSATMSIAIENGALVFKPPQFGTPTVNIDIPWYCYLIGIVVGGALGAILFGTVGNIVGAILAPVLLSSIQGAVQSTLGTTIDTVNSKIGSATSGIQNVDLGSMKTVLQYASIDDMMLLADVQVQDSVPAFREATVFVHNGGYLDLVTGLTAPISGNSGHLGVIGSGSSRVLISIGDTAIAQVGVREPSSVTRYGLYHCSFYTSARLPMPQFVSGNQPNGYVIGVRTADGRYARFTVSGVADDGLWIQYKTYPAEVGAQAPVPVLDITGAFTAKVIHDLPSSTTQPQFQSMAGTASGLWGGWLDPNAHWYDYGLFTANWTGFNGSITLKWKVQGQDLTGHSGMVSVNGVELQYEIFGAQLKLTLDPIVLMNLTIEARMTDNQGRTATASLTAHTVEGGIGGVQPSPDHVPPLDRYFEAYEEHVGPWIEVDPQHYADQGYRVDVVRPNDIVRRILTE
jgi:hypothetical protein